MPPPPPLFGPLYEPSRMPLFKNINSLVTHIITEKQAGQLRKYQYILSR